MPHRTLTALVLFALCWLVSAPVRAQKSPQQNILQQTLRDIRLGDSWIYDDWDAARKLAAREGKPIFAVFRCVP